MKNRFLFLISSCAFVSLGASLFAGADEIKMEWQSSGIMQKAGGYRPLHVVLSPDKPAGIKAVPSDLSAPLYGMLELGPTNAAMSFFVIVDEPEGKPSRLFVDANANGDLTDDPPTEWKGRTDKNADGVELTSYQGGAELLVPYGAEKLKAHLGIYRFDKHDSRRAAVANFLFYYGDYGRLGDVSLGGKTYHAMLLDDGGTGNFLAAKGDTNSAVTLMLDLNNNGKFESRGESIKVTKPFNIGGTTYEIAGLTASGSAFQIVRSSETAEENKPPPNLEVGAKALAFTAKTTDGDTINFPDKYKGKLVMLDFWATWCPPCRGEVPHLAATYEKYHAKGFEVLSISLDQANSAEKLAQFTKENHMPWPEVYDGKYWSADVAQMYFIQSIPASFLIDGETGAIVAKGNDLRGDALAATIEKNLAKHQD